jgi:selenocysteine-specific elongation factor
MSAQRKNIMLGTAGHVDHGKTALVKLLTGCNTDTLAEEKQRGMTIDLGFAPCRLADERIVGVVDVPGHVDFIRNMVAGAHGIDVVIFVIAADDGIMPQTREHLHILTLMGLRHGLVALTKIDLVEPAMRDLVVKEVRGLLHGTFLERAPICPLSNLTGEGYENFFDALNQVTDACDAKPSSGFFRVWIEDVFTIRGFGTVITGIPTSGTARLGDQLEIIPGALAGRVRHLQVYGEDATEGRAGECVAINLAELDYEKVRRGLVVCEAGSVSAVSMAEAELRLLESAKLELKDYAEVHLHLGTTAVQARVAMLEYNRMAPGQSQMVQLRLAQPLGLVPGERFVIRANTTGSDQTGLTTIGGGRILEVSNVRLRRHRSWTLESLQARQHAIDQPERWCEVVLKQSARPVSPAELSKASWLRIDEVRQILTRLAENQAAVANAQGAWAHRDSIQLVADKLMQALLAFHQANPQRLGIEPKEWSAGLNLEKSLVDFAVQHLLQNHRVEQRGALLAMVGWQAQVSNAAQTLGDRIAQRFQQVGYLAPTLEELGTELKTPWPQLQAACQLLIEKGILVRLDEKTIIHRDAIAAAQQVVLRLFAKGPSFTTMDFRDALGVSRKYAVPLLDYLDKTRFTVRTGNHRTPGAEAKARM